VKRLLVLITVTSAACGYENSQAHLRTAIDAQQDALDACYARTLASTPDTQGAMHVIVRVPRGSGQVEGVGVETGSEVSDRRLERCVQRVLVGIPIGTMPIEDDLNVAYTFQFEPKS